MFADDAAKATKTGRAAGAGPAGAPLHTAARTVHAGLECLAADAIARRLVGGGADTLAFLMGAVLGAGRARTFAVRIERRRDRWAGSRKRQS